ncbi:unnamed protein product [Rotaria socialis]|uniref:EF-hand domain-containing protein n=1 Tax=Rotaria socialis TaxID=392032 RepID=A0A817NFV2_9BILA|nr:unnamed protein product [Rotaria socialis]CAF3334965.1 unnamed protein product [Rotaria socialis]CAF3470586.1 unnamed protein product [Rotaria socialis]CAF3494461.1 unnamed protein product [Rotaria socialis]CAF4109731.1 unnamed protein product [Rotaria socialis]
MAEETIVEYPTLTEQDAFELRRIFSSFDNDNDGFVDAKDVSALFKYLEHNFQSFVIKEDELKVLLDRNHINESQPISFTQFLTLIAYKVTEFDNLEELQEAFLIFDPTGSGFITTKDLLRVMQSLDENITEADAQEMMRQADRSLSGKLSFAEFIDMIRYAQST